MLPPGAEDVKNKTTVWKALFDGFDKIDGVPSDADRKVTLGLHFGCAWNTSDIFEVFAEHHACVCRTPCLCLQNTMPVFPEHHACVSRTPCLCFQNTMPVFPEQLSCIHTMSLDLLVCGCGLLILLSQDAAEAIQVSKQNEASQHQGVWSGTTLWDSW